MWHKLKSNSIKAGLGAFAFGIANLILQIELTPEGVHMTWLSPSGISISALFALGAYLIISSIFGHELSFSEKETIVKQRQENLPLLRNSIDAILKREGELAFEIGKRPVQSFFDEYLKINKDYKRYRRLLKLHKSEEQTKHKIAILLSIAKFFFPKAICLNDTCKDDEHMAKLEAEKNIYYHRNNDKKLSSIIDQLLYAATKYRSILAFAELATNNKLPYTSVKKYARFEEKPKILEGFMTRSYKAMNDRMELLMRGGDL
jgi:hypothetical protein